MVVSTDVVKALGISPYNADSCMFVESAIIWLKSNTKLNYDYDNMDLTTLPGNVRLFLHKYCQIMRLRLGVASESIGGLSQSFTGDVNDLLRNAAENLLGDDVLKSDISFVSASNRWC